MQTCTHCNQEIQDGVMYCPWCGTEVGSETHDPHNSNAYFQEDPAKDSKINDCDYGYKNISTVPENDINGMAIAGFVLTFFFPLLGLIFSAIGLKRCTGRQNDCKGLAIAGLALSISIIAIRLIVSILFATFIPSIKIIL